MKTKKILGDLNCTMAKMDKDGGNKVQRLHRCGSNYLLSKLIVDNGSRITAIDPLAQDPG